jgi:hypothetical protein
MILIVHYPLILIIGYRLKINQWSEGLRFVQFQKNRSHHRVINQPPYKVLFGADPKFGLSSSIPKELLPQLETEEDLEQILVDAGEGDTTDDTTDDWSFQQNPDFWVPWPAVNKYKFLP